ncbi:MAG: hypothetical protein GTO18_07810 [Anaerolineales bacterium]|nr:hypothetical protein [Anaerolineales bacterium]
MPAMHVKTFEVRHYECDAYGHLNNAVYLRYMQEAGIEAAASVGFDHSWHRATNQTWLPRTTFIEYLQPATMNDVLEVKTWLGGIRRVIARRMYEFKLKGEDDPNAKAYTDWVFLDQGNLRPVTIPPEVINTFFPDETPAPALTRGSFPEAPPPPPGVFRMRKRVEWNDVDPLMHLNNAAYVDYAMECAVQLTSYYGWPMKRWIDEGIAFVARQHHIEYLIPAEMDAEMEIATWLFDIRPATVTRQFEFYAVEGGDLLARIQTLWVMLDLIQRRPVRIPPEIQDILGPNIAQRES